MKEGTHTQPQALPGGLKLLGGCVSPVQARGNFSFSISAIAAAGFLTFAPAMK